jgi:hypothetical protein
MYSWRLKPDAPASGGTTIVGGAQELVGVDVPRPCGTPQPLLAQGRSRTPYDEERPLIQARDLEGRPAPGRFLIRNSVFRTNQPYDDSSKPSAELLSQTAGTWWYLANGHIPAGSREFAPEPIPDWVTTLRTRAKE